MANPRQVARFFEAAHASRGDQVEMTAHFRTTRGQGLADVLAALGTACRSFESSVGALAGPADSHRGA